MFRHATRHAFATEHVERSEQRDRAAALAQAGADAGIHALRIGFVASSHRSVLSHVRRACQTSRG
jgi:hypothetical protein